MQNLNFHGSCDGGVDSTAVFQSMTPCSVIDVYKCFQSAEDEGNRFI